MCPARNKGAAAAARLCSAPAAEIPSFISMVGDDPAGHMLMASLQKLRLDSSGVLMLPGVATSVVAAVMDKAGEVAACVADVMALEQSLTPERLKAFEPRMQKAAIVVIETNLGAPALEYVCTVAHASGVPVLLEPVSVPKAARALPVLHCCTYITPNTAELQALADAVWGRTHPAHVAPPWQADDSRTADEPSRSSSSSGSSRPHQLHHQSAAPAAVTEIERVLARSAMQAAVLLGEGVRCVVLTLGSLGAALLVQQQQQQQQQPHPSSLEGPRSAAHTLASLGASRGSPCGSSSSAGGSGSSGSSSSSNSADLPQHVSRAGRAPASSRHTVVSVSHLSAAAVAVVNVSGAGDTLVAGFVAGLHTGATPLQALALGMAAAKRAVMSEDNVPPGLEMAHLQADAAVAFATRQHRTFTKYGKTFEELSPEERQSVGGTIGGRKRVDDIGPEGMSEMSKQQESVKAKHASEESK
ncbi:MAG: hypothetical protein WDW36_003030 [Sanguina aurantia]